MNRSLLIAALIVAAPAFAQWPSDKPKTETKTDTAAPPPPAPPPPKRAAQRSGPAEDDGSGFGLGLRGAWAFPTGGLTANENLSGTVSGQLPVWVEAGYHINRNIYAGLYYQYAFGFANCAVASTCSASGMRFGIEALYNFAPTAVMQPWAGLGFGYEILNSSRAAGDDRTFKGLEILNVQLGFDYGLSKSFTIGPFASYQILGKFSSFSTGGVTNDFSNTTGHGWLQVGLKAGLTL